MTYVITRVPSQKHESSTKLSPRTLYRTASRARPMDNFFGRKRHLYASVQGLLALDPPGERSHVGRNRDNSTAGTLVPLSVTNKVCTGRPPRWKANRSLFPFSSLFFRDSIERMDSPDRSRLSSGLLRHLAAVVHVNAHDFAAVLPLARHEVEIRLVRLCSSARRIV